MYRQLFVSGMTVLANNLLLHFCIRDVQCLLAKYKLGATQVGLSGPIVSNRLDSINLQLIRS